MSLAQSFNSPPVDPEIPLSMARAVAAQIRARSEPSHVILFGSAAEKRFRVGSDLDFLVVFDDSDAVRMGRRKIRAAGRLSDMSIPIDLLFVTKDHFEAYRNVGGVCFVASHHGIEL